MPNSTNNKCYFAEKRFQDTDRDHVKIARPSRGEPFDTYRRESVCQRSPPILQTLFWRRFMIINYERRRNRKRTDSGRECRVRRGNSGSHRGWMDDRRETRSPRTLSTCSRSCCKQLPWIYLEPLRRIQVRKWCQIYSSIRYQYHVYLIESLKKIRNQLFLAFRSLRLRFSSFAFGCAASFGPFGGVDFGLVRCAVRTSLSSDLLDSFVVRSDRCQIGFYQRKCHIVIRWVAFRMRHKQFGFL